MSKRVALPGAIRAIREAKSATDTAYLGSKFAIALGMSHAHLCNLEKGRKPVTPDVLERIAQHLKVDVDAISYTIEESEAS